MSPVRMRFVGHFGKNSCRKTEIQFYHLDWTSGTLGGLAPRQLQTLVVKIARIRRCSFHDIWRLNVHYTAMNCNQ